MAYVKENWKNVTDPSNPGTGAVPISAEIMDKIEQGIIDANTKIDENNTEINKRVDTLNNNISSNIEHIETRVSEMDWITLGEYSVSMDTGWRNNSANSSERIFNIPCDPTILSEFSHFRYVVKNLSLTFEAKVHDLVEYGYGSNSFYIYVGKGRDTALVYTSKTYGYNYTARGSHAKTLNFDHIYSNYHHGDNSSYTRPPNIDQYNLDFDTGILTSLDPKASEFNYVVCRANTAYSTRNDANVVTGRVAASFSIEIQGKR